MKKKLSESQIFSKYFQSISNSGDIEPHFIEANLYRKCHWQDFTIKKRDKQKLFNFGPIPFLNFESWYKKLQKQKSANTSRFKFLQQSL